MRTSVLFIIAMLAVFACTGLEAAKAVPLSGVTVADFQSNPGIEEVGWRRRWYRGYAYPAPYAYYPPAYTYYPPPPPFITPLPIRRTPTIALTATTGLITHPTEARPFPGFLLRKGRVRRVDGAVA